MDKLDILEEPDVIEEGVVEAPEPVAEEVDAALEPEPQNIKSAVRPEPGFVPFAAVLDERDKRKALEARLASMQPEPAAQEVPDMFDNPEGYTEYLQNQMEGRLYQQTLTLSERFARQQHGDELTNKALEWGRSRADADPIFNEQVRRSADPVGFAVTEFNKEQIYSTVKPDELEKFRAWQEAQAAVQQPTKEQPPTPKTISSLPSAGGVAHVPTGPGAAFDSTFEG